MKLEEFLRDRQALWADLAVLTKEAGSRPEKLGAAKVRRLGRLYRGAAADLSYARRRFPDDPETRRLGDLVLRARPLVYDTERRRTSAVDFLRTTYWRLIRKRPGPLAAAAAFLLIPALAAWVWASIDPDAAAGLVPAQFEAAIQPGVEGTDQGMSAAEQAAFSTELFTNNIQVTFLAFASGILFGVGTAVLLVYNGLILGVVGGLLVEGGELDFFIELIAAHGVLEISCIIVAGAAGIRMGWALVDPGLRTRVAALSEEARESVLIIIGTMPWLVVAGLIEAFVSRRGLSAAPVTVIGLVVGAAYWLLIFVRGAAPAEPAPDHTLALAFDRR